MSVPIKVSRAQWDAARNRMIRVELRAAGRDTMTQLLEAAIGERPAPDTPPDIEVDGLVIATATTAGVYVDTADLALLLPWVRDHLLPWLEAKTEETKT